MKRHAAIPLVLGAMLVAASGSALAQGTPKSHWEAAYDPATQTRFIPLELILGGDWDGRRELKLPAGRFSESVRYSASTWTGPTEWRHRDTGETMMVYQRNRGGVAQKMAVRKAGDAIGRVEDSRRDSTCDQEAKFPLGLWRQGETRQYEYFCWYGPAEARQRRGRIVILTIEEIDFTHAGAAHSLRLLWIHKQKDDDRELDRKVYVFSPGVSLVQVR